MLLSLKELYQKFLMKYQNHPEVIGYTVDLVNRRNLYTYPEIRIKLPLSIFRHNFLPPQ